ncbi:unnamed protein product [Urochloa decumbens]|uniref:Uncharacterized protein n=1 Tax=Urochloa decumbens TaxID=240449 RepID=A0ABC8Y249_9POAL
MAAPLEPVETTESTCAPKTARGRHVFRVTGYSLLKGLGAGNFIRSATFAVGGHDWCVRFYPNVDGLDVTDELISIYVDRLSKGTQVRALFGLRLTKRDKNLSRPKYMTPKICNFNHSRTTCGYKRFIKRSELEASRFLLNDRLLVVCDITVILGTPVSQSEPVCEIQVPPSDLSDNLGKLLESEEGADVTFEVEGEVFHAHKTLLAMRSPVFKAELFGPMRDRETKAIKVEDMQPSVFKALLHFVYKDSLPTMDDLHLDVEDKEEVVKHLLVAADRYAMERMKLLCESILCKKLNVETVATTLALADKHHCSTLKDACIQYIISSSNRMDDMIASQGYEHLKRACPAVFVDIWEKSAKSG